MSEQELEKEIEEMKTLIEICASDMTSMTHEELVELAKLYHNHKIPDELNDEYLSKENVLERIDKIHTLFKSFLKGYKPTKKGDILTGDDKIGIEEMINVVKASLDANGLKPTKKFDKLFKKLKSLESISMKIRPEIIGFARVMELVMHEHDKDKGDSWKKMKLTRLKNMLTEHMREYIATHNKDELVDIANFCMMIYIREIQVEKVMSAIDFKKFKEGDFVEMKYRNQYGTVFTKRVIVESISKTHFDIFYLNGVSIHSCALLEDYWVSVKHIKPTKKEIKSIKLIRKDLKDGTYKYIG